MTSLRKKMTTIAVSHTKEGHVNLNKIRRRAPTAVSCAKELVSWAKELSEKHG